MHSTAAPSGTIFARKNDRSIFTLSAPERKAGKLLTFNHIECDPTPAVISSIKRCASATKRAAL